MGDYECPDCHHVRTYKVSDNTISLKCPACKRSHCVNCNRRGHFPSSCVDVTYWDEVVSQNPVPSYLITYVKSKINSMNEDLQSTNELHIRIQHDDDIRQHHPRLLDASTEMIEMSHILYWSCISYARNSNLLHNFQILVEAVFDSFSLLKNRLSKWTNPEGNEPCFNLPICRRRQEDALYDAVIVLRHYAARDVFELLLYFHRNGADDSGEHWYHSLSSEMSVWDQRRL